MLEFDDRRGEDSLVFDAEVCHAGKHLIDHSDVRSQIILDQVRHQVATDEATSSEDQNRRLVGGHSES